MQVICHALSLGHTNLILFVTLKLLRLVWRQVCTKCILRVRKKSILWEKFYYIIGIGGDVINVAPGVSVEFACTGPDPPTWFVNGRVAATEGDCFRSTLRRTEGLNLTATLVINGNHICSMFKAACRIYRESQFLYLHNTTLIVQG